LKKSIIHKVEKQYGKDNPKTYATLWTIYNKKKKNEEVPGTSTADVVGTGDDGEAWKKKKKKNPWDKYAPDALGRQFHVEMEEERNYRKEYDNYHAQPDQRERNAGRLRARRLMAKLGKVSKGDKKDVHHKDNDPLNNDKGNLSVTTQKYNRTEPRLRENDAVAEPNFTPDDTFAGVDVFNVNDDEYNNCKHGKKKHQRWSNYVDMDSETGKRIYGYAQKNPKKSIIVQHDKTGHMLYLKKYDMGGES
jgi:hypothetical protein